MPALKTIFARNMSRIRSHYEYTHKQAANVIGISVENLQAYENGAEPGFDVLRKICKAYGVTNIAGLLWDPDFLITKNGGDNDLGKQTLLEYYYGKLKSPAREAVNILMGITN